MFFNQGKPHRFPVKPFQCPAEDPLAPEHAILAAFLAENITETWRNYSDLDLSASESGRKLQDADAAASARLVAALVRQLHHYDDMGRKARSLTSSEMERINWHHSCPEWSAIWPARSALSQAVKRLMRRKLPLSGEHLTAMARWIGADEAPSDYNFPLKAFTKAIESLNGEALTEPTLRAAVTLVSQQLRDSHWKELPKLAHALGKALGESETSTPDEKDEAPVRTAGPDPAVPADAGSARVLVQLKNYLGTMPSMGTAEVETIGFDHFPLRPDTAFRAEHDLINSLLTEVVERSGYHSPVLAQLESGRSMLAAKDYSRGQILLALAERGTNANFVSGGGLEDHRCWQSQYAIHGTFHALVQTLPKLNRESLFDLLLYLSALNTYRWNGCAEITRKYLEQIPHHVQIAPLRPGERHVLHRLRCRFVRACPFGVLPEEVALLNQFLGEDRFLALVPGEAWADGVNAELGAMPKSQQAKWLELLAHASSASGARPSAKWLKGAADLRAAVRKDAFGRALQRWLPLVNVPRTVRTLSGEYGARTDGDGVFNDDNSTCLRGLVWMAPAVADSDLVRILGALTVSCYRKVPGVGPRAVKVGNAGVYALSQINDPAAVGQLALLKVKVKFGSAQKEIEKAFTAAAERSGLPRDEIEEMSIPTYGLTGVGVAEEPMGEFTARLTITGTTTTELVWVKADGKTQRAVPASVKESHKDDLKEMQAAAKDIQRMLPAQRERIDGLFLQQKTWPLSVWLERYLNHPLIGTLARRILWEFKSGDKLVTAIWFNGCLVDCDLKPVDLPLDQTTVQLWHPIGKSPEEIVAWRSWLDAQQIQQPFKQAHREIYPLTAAEQNTRVYSNRYAAHVLKQHQFNALCALRGWKNQLRLMVDAEYRPPTLHLPQWGLRAEFWIEGVGTDYGTDTNDSGVYLYLSTDQVRFYRVDAAQRTAHAGGGGYHPGYHNIDAEPVPLEEIPPLVFSEVMRDVDLFVGVASVGNDPAWSDGGPQGRFQEYWQNYSFGELNASAKTRKDVLEHLVPKLKIASRCSFVDKFMVVKGRLRTYKIHLGSGNILMEPNDQYLCIVPKQGDAENEPVLLPFEGDRTLSVILSKAFLLADDAKIKDPTILSQLKR
jgi:hypothetical protein